MNVLKAMLRLRKEAHLSRSDVVKELGTYLGKEYSGESVKNWEKGKYLNPEYLEAYVRVCCSHLKIYNADDKVSEMLDKYNKSSCVDLSDISITDEDSLNDLIQRLKEYHKNISKKDSVVYGNKEELKGVRKELVIKTLGDYISSLEIIMKM